MFITKIKLFLCKFRQKMELDLGSALIFIFTKVFKQMPHENKSGIRKCSVLAWVRTLRPH